MAATRQSVHLYYRLIKKQSTYRICLYIKANETELGVVKNMRLHQCKKFSVTKKQL